MPKKQQKEIKNIEMTEEDSIELNQELMDAFGEGIENSIEKVLNQKDWNADIDLELLTILMMFAVQTASSIGMEEDEIHDFLQQFIESEEDNQEDSKKEFEMYSINTQVKNHGKPN